MDCNGACGCTFGTTGCASNLDECGHCNGGNQDKDCAEVCYGLSELDNCGTCDSDSTNDCIQDCNQVWGGDAFTDACGVCSSNTDTPGCDCNPTDDQSYTCDLNTTCSGQTAYSNGIPVCTPCTTENCFGDWDTDYFTCNYSEQDCLEDGCDPDNEYCLINPCTGIDAPGGSGGTSACTDDMPDCYDNNGVGTCYCAAEGCYQPDNCGDCAGICGGDSIVDDCGNCQGDGTYLLQGCNK